MLRELGIGICLAWAAAGPPAAADSAFPEEPPAAAVLADLPFLDAADANRVSIDLAPEGSARPFPLQLDTGAQTSVLTPALARELGVNVRRLKTTPYRRATRLGRDLLFEVQTRHSDQSTTSPFEYGLLGGQFLSKYVVEIDYAARRVRFFDADLWAVPEQATAAETAVLPLSLVAQRPVVEVGINGEGVEMLLDTGSPFAVIVGGRAAKKLAPEPRPLHGLRLFGVVGEIGASFAEADRFALGPFAIAHQPLVIAPRGLHQQGTASDSVLGHDLLALFTVRIDYPRRRLWLRRSAPLEPRLLGLHWTAVREGGAALARRDDGVWVRFVVGGSPAERLGLAPNDLVEFVDGAPPPADLAAVQEAIQQAEVVRVQRLAEGGGRWESVSLRPPAAPLAPSPAARPAPSPDS